MNRRDYTLEERRRERLAAVAMLIAWLLITALVVYGLLQLNELLVTF